MRLHLIAAALALGLFGSGCMTRALLRVSDEPKGHITLIETQDVTSYWVYAVQKHVFWQCTESGAALTCEKACDGKNDVVCPTGRGINVTSANLN